MTQSKGIHESIRLSKILKPEYERLFGKVDETIGYSLQTIKLKDGNYLVIKHYSRNDYHSEIEDKTLFRINGQVIRDCKSVGAWNPEIIK